MIIQCPTCRALVDVRSVELDVSAERAGLRCADCGAVSWLGTSPGEAIVEAAVGGDDPSGAKAHPEHSVADAAGGAGSAGAAPEASAGEAPEANPSVPVALAAAREAVEALSVTQHGEGAAEVQQAFTRLFDDWENEEAHKKVVQLAMVGGHLAVVGQSYRAVLEKRADDVAATKGRERVLAAAMTQMTDLPGTDPLAGSRRAVTVVAAVVCGLIILACGYFVMNVTLPKLMNPEQATFAEPR